MKRVLVTGAGGFVGARILDMWRGQFALCAFPSDALRTADENAVLRFILKEHPDVIVHTAALSNTQYCQQEPEDSFRANVLLPEWVAKGAEEVGAKLLSCSSDQVYAGVTQRGARAETLPLSPSNVYGQHKLEAEARVLARCPDAVALRLPWMYDLPGYHLPVRGSLPLNILRVIVGPYPFFEVYHQPVYVSVLWAVGLLGVNYLYAWLLWHLGGGRPRSAR